MTVSGMMAAGTPAGQAKAIAGSQYSDLVGAGTTAADAATITTPIVGITGAGNSGVILKTAVAGDEYVGTNTGGNTVILYPPTGGTLNGAASINIPTAKGFVAKAVTNLSYAVILSA